MFERKKLEYFESKKRSIVKAVSYRLFSSTYTVIISYAITGIWTAAFSIGVIEFVTKIFNYFIHERIWGRIKWGKIEQDYTI